MSSLSFLKKFPQVLLGLSSWLVVSNGLLLQCDYSFITHGSIDEEVYTCSARVIHAYGEYHVVNVSDNHLDGQSHSTVLGLVFHQTLSSAPLSIHQFFENLEIYVSRSTDWPELTRESLEGFSNLRVLDFGGNSLKAIDNDLFIGNPSLESIYFDSNPIQHIAPQVFDHLNQLHTLNMGDTSCIDQSADNDRSEVDILTFNLIVSCPPTFAMTETKIINGSELQSKVQERMDMAIDPIRENLLAIQEELQALERRIEELENEGD